ncbi:MAG: FkbM family methyltransferase [Phycisphaeraceae bacterium]
MQAPEPQPFNQASRSLCLSERLLGGLLRLLPVRHGRHLLLSHLDRSIRLGGKGWADVPFPNGSIVIDSGDLVGRHFALLRDFDPHVCDVLAATAAGGDTPSVLWDIGANQGTCSYQMIRRVPGIRVVAIEPQAELFALLNHNLNSLAPGRYETFHVGIGSQNDQLTLTIEDGNRGHASLYETDVNTSSTSETVSIVTPGDVLERSTMGPPDLIKIDVEGYESVVIEALGKQLAMWSTRAIVFESHLETRPKFVAMIDTLTSAGYDIYRITKTINRTLLYPLATSSQPATDFVALRQGAGRSGALKRMMRS